MLWMNILLKHDPSQTEWFPGQLIQVMRHDKSCHSYSGDDELLMIVRSAYLAWPPYSSRAHLFIFYGYFRTEFKTYTDGGRGVIDPVPPGSV
jgi:hypothetical protein